MKNKLLILSGGMDSVTMLYDYQKEIGLALSFDYGANHNSKEIAFARYHCEQLGIKHLVVEMDFMAKYFRSSLLEGADAIPEGDYDEENMKSTVVPFRNGIMLSIAAGMANSMGLNVVMMANHGGDHAIYLDCRPEFVEAMNGAITTGTGNEVRLLTPYTGKSKADIARIGASLGIDYAKTWSCYKGLEHHCGQCGTCRERRQAMIEAGIIDTTIYDN